MPRERLAAWDEVGGGGAKKREEEDDGGDTGSEKKTSWEGVWRAQFGANKKKDVPVRNRGRGGAKGGDRGGGRRKPVDDDEDDTDDGSLLDELYSRDSNPRTKPKPKKSAAAAEEKGKFWLLQRNRNNSTSGNGRGNGSGNDSGDDGGGRYSSDDSVGSCDGDGNDAAETLLNWFGSDNDDEDGDGDDRPRKRVPKFQRRTTGGDDGDGGGKRARRIPRAENSDGDDDDDDDKYSIDSVEIKPPTEANLALRNDQVMKFVRLGCGQVGMDARQCFTSYPTGTLRTLEDYEPFMHPTCASAIDEANTFIIEASREYVNLDMCVEMPRGTPLRTSSARVLGLYLRHAIMKNAIKGVITKTGKLDLLQDFNEAYRLLIGDIRKYVLANTGIDLFQTKVMCGTFRDKRVGTYETAWGI